MPPFVYGGGNADFFFTQNTKSRDRSVVAGSNLFWHTLWTLLALFGAHTPLKSACTQRHTPSEISTKKNADFGSSETHMCMWGANHVGCPRALEMCPEGSKAEIPRTNTFLATLDRCSWPYPAVRLDFHPHPHPSHPHRPTRTDFD